MLNIDIHLRGCILHLYSTLCFYVVCTTLNICIPPMFMWCMLRLLMWQDGGGLRVGICIVFVLYFLVYALLGDGLRVGICIVFVFVLYFVVYALLGGGLRVGGATILS